MDPKSMLNPLGKAFRFTLAASAMGLLCACVFGGKPDTYSSASLVPPEPVTLNSVNRNWTGSRAQIRFPFQITKGTDSEGWFESKWAEFPEDGSEIQFLVSDRDALREIIPKKHILVGASLICDGWSLRRPEKGKDLQVDFHFENYPVRARIVFDDKDLEDLPEAESFLRLKVLKFYAKGEQLSAIPPAPSAPPSPPASAPAVAGPATYKPRSEILAASVQPARVKAGQEVDLIISYRLDGVPAGAVFETVEQRALYQGGEKITAFEEPIDRTPGSFTSSKKVKVPASAKPGVYLFHARVLFAGSEAKAEALFEVVQ